MSSCRPMRCRIVILLPALLLCGCLEEVVEHVTPPVCFAQCTGCCDTNGACQAGTDNSACGAGGASCQSCTGALMCQQGACVQPFVPDSGIDAGTDGGTDGGPPDLAVPAVAVSAV